MRRSPFEARPVGPQVSALNGKTSTLAARRDRWIRAAVVTAAESRLVEDARNEVIELCTGIPNAKWRDNHHQELEHLKTSRADTEREHVFVSTEWIVLRKSSDVLRVIEVAVAFDGNQAGIVLTKASEARPVRSGDMCSPICTSQPLTRSDMDSNTAVDHWNQMSVRDEIEHTAGPWAVDAAKEDVAVES